jgi:hypothetical protein
VPDDKLGQLFGELAAIDLPVPPSERVIARGRRRRRTNRIIACVAVLVAVALAGAVTSYAANVAGQRARGPLAHATKPPRRQSAPAHLPPAGEGRLVLGAGLSPSYQAVFEMARTGGGKAIRVPNLTGVTEGQSVIAPDPAGGWVVTEAAGPVSQVNQQPERLATVSATGTVVTFGPAFSARQSVTSLAVRPDGTAVAVAVSTVSGADDCLCSAAKIELIPLPGHHGAIRTWTLATAGSAAVMDMVKFLSWAPGGASLTYFPGGATGGGFSTHGAVTLDAAAPGATAPATTQWPPFRKGRGSCNGLAGGWDGDSYLALEGCDGSYRLRPADPVTGAAAGPPVTVPMVWGCGSFAVEPLGSTGQMLISGCGNFVDHSGVNHGGRVTTLPNLPGGLTWVSEG